MKKQVMQQSPAWRAMEAGAYGIPVEMYEQHMNAELAAQRERRPFSFRTVTSRTTRSTTRSGKHTATSKSRR